MQKNVIFAVQTGKQRLKQVVKAPPKISNQLMHNFTVWIFRGMLLQNIICLKFYK